MWSHHFMANRWGKSGNSVRLFSWAPKSLWTVTAAMKLKDASWQKSSDKPRQHIEKQRHYWAYKGPYSQSYGVSSSHVWMWQLDHKEGWAPKNWFQTVVLENNLESPLDSMESKRVNPKGNQPRIFTGRTDAKPEAPILWPPDVKSWLTGKDSDAERDWRQEERGWQDEMVGWHHQLSGHEFVQTLGVGEGQGSLLCCSSWDCKELDTAEWLNNKWHLKMHTSMKTILQKHILLTNSSAVTLRVSEGPALPENLVSHHLLCDIAWCEPYGSSTRSAV